MDVMSKRVEAHKHRRCGLEKAPHNKRNNPKEHLRGCAVCLWQVPVVHAVPDMAARLSHLLRVAIGAPKHLALKLRTH